MNPYICPNRFLPHKIMKSFLFFLALIFSGFGAAQDYTKPVAEFPDNLRYRLAFWNMENYFDTINGKGYDGNFTPSGSMNWTGKRFDQKTEKLREVIHAMHPDILGVCEVENGALLKHLITGDSLKKTPYAVVHYESPDERGIDVGLIYNRNKMFVSQSYPIKVLLPDSDATRDILYVRMIIKTKRDTLHLFVNHWPSRKEGLEKSAVKRKMAAETLARFIDSTGIRNKYFVVMGDFNDEPYDPSLKRVLAAEPGLSDDARMVNLPGENPVPFDGTANYSGHWFHFDQIMVSNSLYTSGGDITLRYHAGSYNRFSPEWMTHTTGEYKGTPLRTYLGEDWLNGYSDHFPVIAELRYE